MTQAHGRSSPRKSRWIRTGVVVLLTMGALGLIEEAAPPAIALGIPAQVLAQRAAGLQEMFVAYITWLAEAHARAARDGEDFLLPDQF